MGDRGLGRMCAGTNASSGSDQKQTIVPITSILSLIVNNVNLSLIANNVNPIRRTCFAMRGTISPGLCGAGRREMGLRAMIEIKISEWTEVGSISSKMRYVENFSPVRP